MHYIPCCFAPQSPGTLMHELSNMSTVCVVFGLVTALLSHTVQPPSRKMVCPFTAPDMIAKANPIGH